MNNRTDLIINLLLTLRLNPLQSLTQPDVNKLPTLSLIEIEKFIQLTSNILRYFGFTPSLQGYLANICDIKRQKWIP